MIITKAKELDIILSLIKNEPVFIIGCSECATLCKTGGEDEIKGMTKVFKEKKIKVTGSVVLDPACHLLNDKRILKEHSKEIEKLFVSRYLFE